MRNRQAARARVFDGSRELADALMDYEGPERWEPLRDLILAGLEAGGLRCAAASTALRSVELSPSARGGAERWRCRFESLAGLQLASAVEL